MDVDGRRLSTESVYETYHLLEAITDSEKLEKLRRTFITLSPGEKVGVAGSGCVFWKRVACQISTFFS